LIGERKDKSDVLMVRSRSNATNVLIKGLEERNYSVTHAVSLQHALAEIHACHYPLILFDLADSLERHRVPEKTVANSYTGETDPATEWLDLLSEIHRVTPGSQVVMIITDRIDLNTCCQAVTNGASSFVEWKDGDPVERIHTRLTQAMTRYEAVVQEGRDCHTQDIFEETGLTGKSRPMAKLLFLAKRAAVISDVPVLIYGESGTGKQLLAEAIHKMDPKRRNKPFMSVNCSAITGSLAESALFGHRKGAFTGATEDRLGYFRAADSGTLLLDEVSELEKHLQPKLLRVLQESLVLPVGDDVERKVNVRVIASSNRPLPVLIEEGKFRIDLYQRLNVIALNIPSLRDRAEDIPPLVQYFIKRYASYYPYPIESVDSKVYELLANSIGSGNVRELENAVRQILVFKRAGNRIELSDIPAGLLTKQKSKQTQFVEPLTTAVENMIGNKSMTLADMIENFESLVLSKALIRSNDNYTELAKRLGLSRRTLYNKINKYDLLKA